jgi:glycine/D-amino acid oxidase-like deaminating enzyme
MTESFWLSEPAEPPASADGGPCPDVAVIGAGVTGCSCALTVAEGGSAYGSTRRGGSPQERAGATAALPCAEGRCRMRRREKKFGREAANAYWRLTERYVDRMEQLAGDALHRVGSLRLADDEELDDLRAEYEGLREEGWRPNGSTSSSRRSTACTGARSGIRGTARSSPRAG